MSRDRKPFTYTPGGLDLSEIKSERMAKRLLRNAMNQGVPELPPQIQSPTFPSTPVAGPNFNCLPVQVFPNFQLPANPKSLLRTLSTPANYSEHLTSRVTPLTPTITTKSKGIDLKEPNKNYSSIPLINNSKNLNNGMPVSMFEYNENANQTASRANCGSKENAKPFLPQIIYDAEYFEVIPRADINNENTGYVSSSIQDNDVSIIVNDSNNVPKFDCTIISILKTKEIPEVIVNKPVNYVAENGQSDEYEQKGVRIVKKKKVSESETRSQNGEQKSNADTELTIQLPNKKSAAKSEIKVEVSNKTLPDGSVEETKRSTTTTTIDGKIEIKTKTEKTTTPKPEYEKVEVGEGKEEENGDVVVHEVEEEDEEKPVTEELVEVSSTNITKTEKQSESTCVTTKKVVLVEEYRTQEDKEDVKEVEQAEESKTEEGKQVEVTEESNDQILVKEDQEEKLVEEIKNEVLKTEVEDEDKNEEVEELKKEVVKKEVQFATKEENLSEEEEEGEEEIEEVEEYEESEEVETKTESSTKETEVSKPEINKPKEEDDKLSEYTEEEYESEVEEAPETVPVKEQKYPEDETKESVPIEKEIKQEVLKPELKQEELREKAPTPKIPLREPSIPLDKVEEVEIKPIGPATETIKTVLQSTEILKGPSDSSGGSLSTQTAYNRIENIVTVNCTSKTLDNSYEKLTQQGIPTVKSYFAPDRERVTISPQPAKAYELLFSTQPEPERRDSLLLESLSTERQMPSDIYQIQCSNRDQQRQWSLEPQSEVVNVSNVKPSTITNSQWFQQTKKDNVTYNNVSSSTESTPAQQWSQPPPPTPPQPQVQQQPLYQPQHQAPSQQLHQQPPAPQYQQLQTQFQQPQPQYQQHQSSYTDSSTQISSNTYQKNSYKPSTPSCTPSYAPKPTNFVPDNYGNTTPNRGNQYFYQNKDSTDIYQKSFSTYVPPPWEQDPNYVAPELPTQNFYQTPSTAFSTSSNSSWKPVKPAGKFPKPAPKAYIPPAPNQSFVKPLNITTEPLKLPGRKTYYSEYERRYISVPDATYVPGENKLQPNPSPQYYYDNSEPTETTEHEWRKELREFTEKSSRCQTQPEQASVKPPWENNIKYGKAPASVPYTPTQSWNQTLRPQSWRERSFESEYLGSNEWSKTNTLGRGRPLSTYGNPGVKTIPERTRGVSVDRYNPNNYKSPMASEHGPVPTHTLNAPVKGYHNLRIPSQNSRASVETRERPMQYARNWGDQRHSPIQSRSFKYLQWFTGTDE